MVLHHTLGDNVDVYFERMRSSLGDKKRLIGYITGTDVLDVGCGSGELVAYLNAEGYTAHGIDPSAESVAQSAELGLNVLSGYADETHQVFGDNSLDTIIASSVMHEVFSYGNRHGAPGQISSLRDALRSYYRALRPGGRLIVRDGVAPGIGVSYMNVDDDDAVEKFLARSPFHFGEDDPVDKDRTIRLRQLSKGRWIGSKSSVMEFAFTHTWGEESFSREVQEFYGIFTLEDYSTFVSEQGFTPVQSYAYTQPGYVQHLKGKVQILPQFPHSNAIWVFNKA